MRANERVHANRIDCATTLHNVRVMLSYLFVCVCVCVQMRGQSQIIFAQLLNFRASCYIRTALICCCFPIEI